MSYRRACVTLVVALALTASLAPAQDRGSQQRKYPIKAMGIMDWGGDIYIRSNYRQHKTKGMTGTPKNSDLMFREGFHLNSKGYVYHPNLVSWNSMFNVGTRQERSEIDGDRARSSGMLLGYTVSGTVLKEKPVSFRVFGGQKQDYRDQGFGESSKRLEDRYGVATRVRSEYPASFMIERIDTNEDSSTRESTLETDHMRFTISHSRNRMHTDFEFDRLDSSQTSVFAPFSGGTTTVDDLSRTRDDARLKHRLLFGSIRDPNTLRGEVQYLDRQDTSDTTTLSAEEVLELIHDETLRSSYSGYYELDETDDQRVERVTGRAGVTKRIYRSLDVSGAGTARNSDFDFGQERVYSGSLGSTYRKRTPIGGYLCRLRLSHQRREQEFIGALQLFRNERVTLTGLAFSPLANANVDNTTVVVRNAGGGLGAGTTIYVPGIDYDLRVTGTITEIAILFGSAISSGDTVLVDYVAEVPQEAVYTTDSLRWSNRIRLKHVPIALYTSLTRQRLNLAEGRDPGNIDKTDAYVLGAEFSKQGFSATVEQSVVDTKLAPTSVTNRVRMGYRRALSRSTRLALAAQAQRLDYTDGEKFGLGPDEDFSETMNARANLTTALSRKSLIRMTSDVTKSRGRDERTTYRNEAALEWAYGKLDLSIRARYDILRQETSQREAVTLRFELSRDF